MAKHEEVKKYIKIRKAAEHNLKDIDVDIPRDEFVYSRDSAVRESHHLLLILFMPKGREDIWSHFHHMRDSFLGLWKSRMLKE